MSQLKSSSQRRAARILIRAGYQPAVVADLYRGPLTAPAARHHVRLRGGPAEAPHPAFPTATRRANPKLGGYYAARLRRKRRLAARAARDS